MNTPTAALQHAIELSGYSFIKCNQTLYWICQDDNDLSEVAAGLFLGPLIYKVADLLGV
jgi:hypothetical protein